MGWSDDHPFFYAMIAIQEINNELFYYCIYNGKEYWLLVEAVAMDCLIYKKDWLEIIYSACKDLQNNY